MQSTASDDMAKAVECELAFEAVAEAKELLIELDRRQSQYREARRKLMKNPPQEENLWMLSHGSTFVSCELDYEDTLRYFDWKMRRGEDEIENAREELKVKVAMLAELEGPDSALAHLYQGFDLKSSNSS